jgi:ribosomal protein L7/L12
LQEELVDIMTWQELYDAGLKVPAIIKYRKLNPSLSLTEAKNFVENYTGE